MKVLIIIALVALVAVNAHGPHGSVKQEDAQSCVKTNSASHQFDFTAFNSAGPHKFYSHGKTYIFNACGDLGSLNIPGCRSNAAVCIIEDGDQRALTAGTVDFVNWRDGQDGRKTLEAHYARGDKCKDPLSANVGPSSATIRYSCCPKLGKTEFRVNVVNGTLCHPIIDIKTGAACPVPSYSADGGNYGIDDYDEDRHSELPLINIIFAGIFYLLLTILACSCCIACCCRRRKYVVKSTTLGSAPVVSGTYPSSSSSASTEMNGYVYHPAPVVVLDAATQSAHEQPPMTFQPVPMYGYYNPATASVVPVMNNNSNQILSDEMLARQLQAQFDQQNA